MGKILFLKFNKTITEHTMSKEGRQNISNILGSRDGTNTNIYIMEVVEGYI
jgi:hypothetical protein